MSRAPSGTPDRVREELLRRCREERIEPPAAARITRIVRSALHNAEETWFDTIAARCGPAASARILALIAEDADPASEDDPRLGQGGATGDVAEDAVRVGITVRYHLYEGLGLPARIQVRSSRPSSRALGRNPAGMPMTNS
jgi:hypothetical protein